MYYIKSEKGYWLENGFGYTKNKKEAAVFTLIQMEALRLNLDGCTLYAAEI